MTGAEYAMTLVRECWVNRPLSDDENCNLQLIMKFATRYPALMLICDNIYQVSSELSVLYDTKINAIAQTLSSQIIDCRTRYTNQEHNKSYRKSLNNYESLQIFGKPTTKLFTSTESFEKKISWKTFGSQKLPWIKELELPPDDELYYDFGEKVETLPFKFVEEIEKKLKEYVLPLEENNLSSTFPVKNYDKSKVADHIISKLDESWRKYESLKNYYLPNSIEYYKETIENDTLPQIISYRCRSQSYIINSLNKIPFHFTILRLSDVEPTVGVRDILFCAIDKKIISVFNPFLTSRSVDLLYETIIFWLKLCVLEDKIYRILSFNDKDSLIQEFLCCRDWDASKYVQFLVFEVENKLQIRPLQFSVFRDMVNDETPRTMF